MYSGSAKNDTTGYAANAVQNASQTVADTLGDASRKVRKALDSTAGTVSRTTGTVTRQVRTNPVQSTLIALGVGYLLGKISRH